MGAFEKLFGNLKKRREVNGYFRLLNGYTPVFTTFDGGVYEMELTRACIHTFASHCSKLQPTVTGPDLGNIQFLLDGKPNPFMTSSQFVYKAATIYETQPSCVIMPVMDKFDRLIGYYPASPQMLEVVDVGGEPYIRVTFESGKKTAVELSRCGVLSKYLYKNDVIGEGNGAVQSTLQLLHMQEEGIAEGIKNGATFRFMAVLNNFAKDSDVKKKREEFVRENLGAGSGGLALFPNYMSSVQQINSTAKVVDPEQLRLIQERVFTYFGSNEDILQNKFDGDKWAAYYEGKVEVFSLQLSQAMTAMSFTDIQRKRGNGIVWSANRIQYMSNQDKLQVSTQLFDRGILSIDQVMDIWNLPHVPGGHRRFIRKEYIDTALIEYAPKVEGEEEGSAEEQAEL